MSQRVHDDYDHSFGRRAAADHLAAQLPPHGRHAGQHGPSIAADENNRVQYVQRVNPSAEIVGNVYEATDATYYRNPRKGRVIAAENLVGRDSATMDAFAQEFMQARSSSAPVFTRTDAPGRSPIADGSDRGAPYARREVADNFGFLMGAALPEHPQSNNTLINGPLDLTERGRTTVGRTWGSDVRVVRRNIARIED
jgi:hypothetical protein